MEGQATKDRGFAVLGHMQVTSQVLTTCLDDAIAIEEEVDEDKARKMMSCNKTSIPRHKELKWPYPIHQRRLACMRMLLNQLKQHANLS